MAIGGEVRVTQQSIPSPDGASGWGLAHAPEACATPSPSGVCARVLAHAAEACATPSGVCPCPHTEAP
jgi:hypothetical protein